MLVSVGTRDAIKCTLNCCITYWYFYFPILCTLVIPLLVCLVVMLCLGFILELVKFVNVYVFVAFDCPLFIQGTSNVCL